VGLIKKANVHFVLDKGTVSVKARKHAVCGRIKQLLILLDTEMLVHITTEVPEEPK
jgi:hypothetical protein